MQHQNIVFFVILDASPLDLNADKTGRVFGIDF